MAILRVLDTLEKLEAKMADLYEWFATIFAADSEATEFFYRMSLDETAHANLVRYYRRMASKDAKVLGEVALDVEPLKATMERINAVLSGPKPSLEEAVKIAVDLEINAAESHAIASLVTAAPGLAPLLTNLGSLDSKHHRVLEEFAASGKSPFVSGPKPVPEPLSAERETEEKPPKIPIETLERIEYYHQWYKTMDYYKVLGLKNYATREQIKKAFHVRAREFHPDRYPHGEIQRKLHEIFSYMTNAYATLMDPEERRKYDRSVNTRGRK
ncbi:MAG: J domain-containing protein [Nitrospirota bacterium]